MGEDLVKHYKFCFFSAKNFFSMRSTIDAEPFEEYFSCVKFSTQVWISL